MKFLAEPETPNAISCCVPKCVIMFSSTFLLYFCHCYGLVGISESVAIKEDCSSNFQLCDFCGIKKFGGPSVLGAEPCAGVDSREIILFLGLSKIERLRAIFKLPAMCALSVR